MNTGSYQLHIYINKDIEIKIGQLGTFQFKMGYYIYTGSAMRNLCQRIMRHLSKNKKMRWHIDYLLANNEVSISKVLIYPSNKREECLKNSELLENVNYSVPVIGFGSSDCKKCPAHLVYYNHSK
jgi:Uri superfamily endonuclease